MACFIVFWRFFFSKLVILKSFQDTIKVSNSLDFDLVQFLLSLIYVQTVCKDYLQTNTIFVFDMI